MQRSKTTKHKGPKLIEHLHKHYSPTPTTASTKPSSKAFKDATVAGTGVVGGGGGVGSPSAAAGGAGVGVGGVGVPPLSPRPLPDLLVKQLWLTYVDSSDQSMLTEPQSLLFLVHYLRHTPRLRALIKEQLSKRVTISTSPSKAEKEQQQQQYWEEFANVLLSEVDPDVKGGLTLEVFSKVLTTDWWDFVRGAVKQGEEHRQLTIRLREEKKKKALEKSSKKKKKKKFTTEQQEEALEIDKIWEDNIEQEVRDQLIEKEACTSLALSTANIHNLRSFQINEVSEILNIKSHVAEALLDYVKWNQDKLMTEYFNNQEQFLKSAGIDPSSIASQQQQQQQQQGSDEKPRNIEEGEICCSICFDDVPPSNTSCIEACGHVFCNNCWSEMLEMQIKEGHTFDILCMQKGCNELVPPSLVDKLVLPLTRSRYMHFLSKTFVDHAKHIRWCPAPGCDNAITEAVTEGRVRVATCLCGNRICWECEREAHPPIGCKVLQKFENIVKQDESNLGFMIDNNLDANTLKWMQENTKQCPFCSVVVQKYNGCYCMTCKQCNQSWCWLCREPWLPTHTNHFKCTKYNAGGSQLTNKPRYKDKETFKSRIQLERLAHYCRLFQEQTKAIKLESNPELKEQDKKKEQEIKKEYESLDTTFIAEGRLQLKKCRETLKYSYVHTYFLKPRTTPHKIIEYLQENLEMSIERLAQSLDKPLEETNPPEIRKLTRVATQALSGLLEYLVSNTVDRLVLPKQVSTSTTTTTVQKEKSRKAKPQKENNNEENYNNNAEAPTLGTIAEVAPTDNQVEEQTL